MNENDIVCDGCGKLTSTPQLSLEGEKLLCRECADAEKEYWENYYHGQKMLEELYRREE